MDRPGTYGMFRGPKNKAERVADVVVFPNGKCCVAWRGLPSVIVYDSLADAEAVHIKHMGTRGETTVFVVDHD